MINGLSPDMMLINKIKKNIFLTADTELKFMYEIRTRNDIEWDSKISEEIRIHAFNLLK